MPRKPRQARSLSTVQAIVDAGFICLQQHGMAGTTTNHIASVAGVSTGSLYEYFANKEAIYAAMIECFQQDLAHFIQSTAPVAARLDVDQAIRELTRGFLELLQRNDGRYLALLRFLQDNRLQVHTEQTSSLLLDLIVQYLIHHPQFTRLSNLRTMSYIIINSGMYNLVHHLTRDDPPISLDELIEGMIALITGYIQFDLSRQTVSD